MFSGCIVARHFPIMSAIDAKRGEKKMRATASWALSAVAIMSLATSTVATAQEAPKWSDVDCAQSHIVGPTGMKCRATQVYSGGNKMASDANGTFQHWNMSGTVNGAKLFFFGKEAVDPNTSIIAVSIEDAVRDFAPGGKSAKNVAAAAPIAGGDYSRFTGANDDVCVATRKVGPPRKRGSAWYLLSTKCVPKGQTISDADIASLIAAANFRG